MTYEVKFNALNINGGVQGSGSFSITTPIPLDLSKQMCVERFCVEYARLTGIKCSFAQVIIMERGDSK